MAHTPYESARSQVRAQSVSPQLRIPVQPEDVARRKRRIAGYILAGILAVVAAGAWIYKRSVDPIHAMQSYDDATRFFKAARFNQAILALDLTIALKPGFADAYLLRGRAYAGDSNSVPAIRDFSTALQLRPADTAAMLYRASAYMDQKDYQSAIADATTAIHVDPNLSQAYNLRGCARRALGDPSGSLDDFTRAVEIDPNLDNYYQRATTYQMLGQHRLAIADFDEVINLDPEEAPVYYARARSRRAIGDRAGALEDQSQGLITNGLKPRSAH